MHSVVLNTELLLFMSLIKDFNLRKEQQTFCLSVCVLLRDAF